jgi:hypothetical protein
MNCRICGHDNAEKDTGACANCGFKLDDQNSPLKELRSALQKPLPPDGNEKEHPAALWVPKKSIAGYLSVLIMAAGATIAIFILASFERAEYEPHYEAVAVEIAEDLGPRDSLPILLDTDIVYEFNTAGTSAIPRTNVNLSLIPVGTRVSFLGHSELSIRPVVSYITRKMAERDFLILEPHNLICWTDTTMSEFLAVPLVKPFVENPADTSAVEPVLMRFLFTDEWLRGEVQEFNIDVVEPSGGFRFNARPFESVLRQVNNRLARRDYGDRPVHVVLLFPDHSTLGQVMDITLEVQHYTDSLGYMGFQFRYATIE